MKASKNLHTVVGITGDTLTTSTADGKQHSYTMAKGATVTCDGKASQMADLKAGTAVKVTTQTGDPKVATGVESGKHLLTARA